MRITKSQAKQERLPQVPQRPLPELAAFLAPLRGIGIKLSGKCQYGLKKIDLWSQAVA